jgi:hypothetical protein
LRYQRLRFNAVLEFNDQLFILRDIYRLNHNNNFLIYNFDFKFNYDDYCDNNINILELYEHDLDNYHFHFIFNHLHGYPGKSDHGLFHRPNNDNNLVNLH